MSPWRRWGPPAGPSKAERADLAWAGAGLLLAGLVLLAALLAGGGCAPQVRPECPLGAMVSKVDTGSGTEGLQADLPQGSAAAGQ